MFIIYVNDHEWNKKTQIFEVNKLEVRQKLNDISSVSFEVSNTHKSNSYANFKEFNEVLIYKIENNNEKLIFDGIIRWVEADLSKTKVILNDKIFLLKNKILYTDKSYTNTQIKSILIDVLDAINSRYDTWIILNSDILDQVTKTYKKWQTFFDILKDLALNWYEFEIKNNILYFLNSIWEDKTSWTNFIEFSYDINFPWSRTIDTARLEYDSENISNAVISKDTWNSEDLPSINEFWRQEKYFISWDKYSLLSDRKDSIRELEITPISYDFFVANLWDTVKVFIDAWNDIMQFDSNLKIIEKEFRSWELNKVKIKLSKWNIKTLNLIETIQDLKNRTKNLEI
jgi:hypothetical protein